MAGVSVPITPQPAAPTTPSVTEHSREDRIYNKIAAKLGPAVEAARPIPGIPIPVTAPVTSPISPASTPVETVAAPNEAEVDLSDFDFNAPIEAAPVPAVEAKPVLTAEEIEAKLAADIEAAGAEADSAKLWDKLSSLAVAHPRGKRMLEGLKFMNALAEPPEADGKGGVGRALTIQEIKQADEASRELQLIRHDINTDPRAFVHNLVSLKENGQSWLGDVNITSQVLSEIPRVLIENVKNGSNPVYGQLMANLAGPIFDQFLDHQYKTAQSWPDETPEETAANRRVNPLYMSPKDRFIDALQVVEHRLKGNARSLDPTRSVDPEKERLRQELETSRSNQNRTNQNQVAQMMNAISMENGRNASQAVDLIFQKYGIDKALSKTTLDPQKMAILTGLDQDLSRLNPGGFQAYQMQMDAVARGQLSPEVPKQTYLTMFQNGLKTSPAIKTRLNDLVKDAKRLSDTRTASLVNGQAQVAPNGDGRAAAASVIPGSKAPLEPRKPGESKEDYIQRTLSVKMMAASPVRR